MGVVVDLAPHDLDIMRYLLGSEPVRLYAETEQRIHTDHEDLFNGMIKFANGVVGILDINWLTPTKRRTLTVTGERGMYVVDYINQDLIFYANPDATLTWEDRGADGVTARRYASASGGNTAALSAPPVGDWFLAEAQARVKIGTAKEPLDPRGIELLNKTNQFNLNGRRVTEGAWRSHLREADTFLLIVSYRDKYGPLGKIAVLSGRCTDAAIRVEHWVMSCPGVQQAHRAPMPTVPARSLRRADSRLRFSADQAGSLRCARFLADLAGEPPSQVSC